MGAMPDVCVPMTTEDTMREALVGMVEQFGYWSDTVGGYWTGGLSALEFAFDALGWDDPHPYPSVRCDEPGCMGQRSMGTPTMAGYRHTCSEHGFRLTPLSGEQQIAWRGWSVANPGRTFDDWIATRTPLGPTRVEGRGSVSDAAKT